MKRKDIDKLSEVSEEQLLRFDLLDRETQLKFIEIEGRAALNPQTPRLTREVSKKRVRQFKARMKQKRRKKDS